LIDHVDAKSSPYENRLESFSPIWCAFIAPTALAGTVPHHQGILSGIQWHLKLRISVVAMKGIAIRPRNHRAAESKAALGLQDQWMTGLDFLTSSRK